MTDVGFRNVAGILSGMPAQTKWDDGIALAYGMALQPFSDDEVIKAVVTLLRTEEFRPTPAAIIKVMGKCHDMGRIQRFIDRVHPSMELQTEYRWIEMAMLTDADVKWVRDNGGWGAIRRGKPMAQKDVRGELSGRTNKLITE
jgi:hypothetical protein